MFLDILLLIDRSQLGREIGGGHAIAPLVAMGLIMGGASLVGAYGSWRTARQNRKNQERQNELDRQAQERAYERMRSDALADRDYANDYNSYQSNIQRLREAGLNPRLAYGNDASSTSAVVRGSDYSAPNQQAPQMEDWTPQAMQGIQQSIGNYYNLQKTMADTNLTNQTMQVQKQQELLTQANTAAKLQETARNQWDWETAREIRQDTIDRVRLENDKLRLQNMFTIDENERRQLHSPLVNQKIIQDIAKSKLEQVQLQLKNAQNPLERQKLQETINLLRKTAEIRVSDAEIRAKQAELWRSGVNPNDPLWARMLFEALQELKGNQSSLDDIGNSIDKAGSDIWEFSKNYNPIKKYNDWTKSIWDKAY